MMGKPVVAKNTSNDEDDTAGAADEIVDERRHHSSYGITATTTTTDYCYGFRSPPSPGSPFPHSPDLYQHSPDSSIHPFDEEEEEDHQEQEQDDALEQEEEDVPPDQFLLPMRTRQFDDSPFLRDWQRHKELELQENTHLSDIKHQRILEAAASTIEEFYSKRSIEIAEKKTRNREMEKKMVANMNDLTKSNNVWESVLALIDFDRRVCSSHREEDCKAEDDSRSCCSSSVATSSIKEDAKHGRKTDLTRMRQLLMKLAQSDATSRLPIEKEHTHTHLVPMKEDFL